MEKETKQWLKIALEDKNLAVEMWNSKRYVYAVMFWQQAVEKIIKAYIIEQKNIFPIKTHDIDQLLKQAKIDYKQHGLGKMQELSLAFTRTRYEDLSRQHYTKKTVVEPLIVKANALYLWIEKQLHQH